jgi:ribosomal protein L37AE/L43A
MSMEAQNLRFVRCPKCLQLLVEYPTIPVYQCGGCGTVLRGTDHAIYQLPGYAMFLFFAEFVLILVESVMQRKIEARR